MSETFSGVVGPLWPCGCLVGNPYCDCSGPDPAPVDWPARFRAAAEVAGLDDGMSWLLGHLADTTAEAAPDLVEAIGRALEGRER